MKFPRFLAWAVLCAALSSPLRAEEAGKTAPAPAPAADLTSAKDAAAAWEILEKQIQRRPDKEPESREQMMAYARERVEVLGKLGAELQSRFPKTPEYWKTEMLLVQLNGARRNLDLPAEDEARTTARLEGVVAAADAPADIKEFAAFTLVMRGAREAGQAGGDALATWRGKVAEFLKAYPKAQAGSLLRLTEADVVSKTDAEAGDKLLAELEKSDDERVAAQAKSLRESAKAEAEIKKGPLDLKFTAVDGKEVDLARMRGKVVLVDFWATWCGPCMGEVPNVVAAYEKLHGKGFEIIGISFDQDKDKLLKVTAEQKMTWPQYFDGKGWGNAFGKRFGISGIPTMWLVNKKGMVVDTEAREDLAGKVEKLLAE